MSSGITLLGERLEAIDDYFMKLFQRRASVRASPPFPGREEFIRAFESELKEVAAYRDRTVGALALLLMAMLPANDPTFEVQS